MSCLRGSGSIVSVHSTLAVNTKGIMPSKIEHCSVWALRNPGLFRNFAKTLSELRPPNGANQLSTLSHGSTITVNRGSGGSARRSIVYYSRRSSDTHHGRVMTVEFEQLFIQTISMCFHIHMF